MGRTPVNKKRINNRSKQNEIATSLGSVFFKEGFSNVSTEDLCDIAKKSKATIYKYFKSKEEIVAHITNTKLEEIGKFANLLSDENLSYSERYKNAVELVISAFEGISYKFLDDLKNDYPSLFGGIINLKDFSVELLEGFYQNGIESGDFSKLDPKLLAANDDIFFTAILETDFLENKDFSLQELFEVYFNSRFRGILKQQ